jgi:hypothetical protein
MSDMSQYTEVRCYDKGKGREPATYTAILKVGAQSFQVGMPLPLDEAEWMREQLTIALERMGGTMRKEQEIRERKAMRQREADDVEAFGGARSEDWCAAAMAVRELRWVLME